MIYEYKYDVNEEFVITREFRQNITRMKLDYCFVEKTCYRKTKKGNCKTSSVMMLSVGEEIYIVPIECKEEKMYGIYECMRQFNANHRLPSLTG